jgi:hypothetical protein
MTRKKKSSAKQKKSAAKPRKRSTTLRLDAAFYPAAAVRKAAGAFAHLASIKTRREGRNQVVTFQGMAAGVAERLPDEFANYALSCAVVEP